MTERKRLTKWQRKRVKQCARCGEVKPLREFGFRSGGQDHLRRSYCWECERTYRRQHLQAPAVHLAKVKRWQEQNRERYLLQARARSRTMTLINNGEVRPRPKKCESCGAGGRIEMAHQDYQRPELIDWLCAPCHRRQDRLRALL